MERNEELSQEEQELLQKIGNMAKEYQKNYDLAKEKKETSEENSQELE